MRLQHNATKYHMEEGPGPPIGQKKCQRNIWMDPNINLNVDILTFDIVVQNQYGVIYWRSPSLFLLAGGPCCQTPLQLTTFILTSPEKTFTSSLQKCEIYKNQSRPRTIRRHIYLIKVVFSRKSLLWCCFGTLFANQEFAPQIQWTYVVW